MTALATKEDRERMSERKYLREVSKIQGNNSTRNDRYFPPLPNRDLVRKNVLCRSPEDKVPISSSMSLDYL